jgi:hypothetical protein
MKGLFLVGVAGKMAPCLVSCAVLPILPQCATHQTTAVANVAVVFIGSPLAQYVLETSFAWHWAVLYICSHNLKVCGSEPKL